MRNQILVSILCLALFGCATSDPFVDPQEKKLFSEQLHRKKVDFFFDQTLQVTSLGYQILNSIPLENTEKKPTLPILYVDLKQEYSNYYQTQTEKGVMVVGKLNGFGLEMTDLKRGDIILSVGGEPVSSENEMEKILTSLKNSNHEKVKIIYRRNTNQSELELPILGLAKRLKFVVSGDSLTVNAYTDQREVVTITTAMLHFVENDDELAFILGHEIAHKMKGHIAKTVANNMLGMAAGITLGSLVEVYVPGLGDPVAQISAAVVRSPYSQEMEREADYFGLQYVYHGGYDLDRARKVWERFAVELPASSRGSIVSTHPTSAERFLRMEKSSDLVRSNKSLPALEVQGSQEMVNLKRV